MDKPGLDHFLPYLMNRLVARLNQNLEARLLQRGLSFQHWRVLLVLALRPPRNFTELAEDTLIPQSTLSRLVARMESRGLVARASDGSDARVVRLELSAAGRAAFEQIYPLGFREYRRAADALDVEEERQFVAMLERLIGRLFAEPPVEKVACAAARSDLPRRPRPALSSGKLPTRKERP